MQLLTGPRQCGKRSLLSHLSQGSFTEITFDDLQMRTLAHRDPGLFFEQFAPPCYLMRFSMYPPLFPRSRELSTDTKGSVLRPDNLFRSCSG